MRWIKAAAVKLRNLWAFTCNLPFIFLIITDDSYKRIVCYYYLVPVAGLEPARHRWQWILSPPRLPIPTHRPESEFYLKSFPLYLQVSFSALFPNKTHFKIHQFVFLFLYFCEIFNVFNELIKNKSTISLLYVLLL